MTQQPLRNDYTPDVMAPDWSRALAEVRMSPFWFDATNDTVAAMDRRDTFIEQASQYATYDDLPGDLKATYQDAYRQLRSQQDA